MHYTSGTTGRPKGVTDGLVGRGHRPRRRSRTRPRSGTSTATTSTSSARRMYHTPSIRFASNTLLAGGSLVILSRFDAATALRVIRRHRPTTAFLVPTHLQRILHLPELGPDEKFDSLRLLAHAGLALPRAGQARRHGTGPPRRRLGVLRLHRGAVHGVLARRVAGAPRHRREGPPGPPPFHRAAHRPGRRDRPLRRHLVRVAGLRPLRLLGRPRRDARPPGGRCLHRRRPRHARRRGLPLPDRPAPRPHHQRRRQRLPGRDRERARGRAAASPRWRSSASPTSNGGNGCAPPTSPRRRR